MSELSEILRKVLENRGISAAELDDFLHPSLARLAAPGELPGVERAVEVILTALRDERRIVVFGDYDCDGVCATAIMTMVLRQLGAAVTPFIPDRLTEGYGMSNAAVERMLRENPGVSLVITVDNGINSIEPVRSLAARGIEVVITDHHLPGEELPEALALVNPKVASPRALANLCGAGVAFFLVRELVGRARASNLYGGPKLGGPLLILAGLATVTDIMPLLGQNRILVSEALRHFQQQAPIGLRELYNRAAKVACEHLSSKDFSFLLGPRINAAGRMNSGMEAFELITCEDHARCQALASKVDRYNLDRKAIEQQMTEEAWQHVVHGAAAQVIELPEGHPGVAGIVAARIMEKLGTDPAKCVPVCIIAQGHGSARAPAGVNIRDAMDACKEVLVKYGGHAAAGGFEVKPGKIDEFRRRLNEYCGKLGEHAEVAAKRAQVDVWLSPDEVTLDLVDEIARLEPFGEGNPEPVFGFKAVLLKDIRTLGGEGKHLSFQTSGFKAVWWNHGDLLEELRRANDTRYDLTFTLERSDYGFAHVELRPVSLLISNPQ